MSKKTKKDREIKKLRREVEALRAQAKVLGSQRVKVSKKEKTDTEPEPPVAEVTDIRSDLRKTAILTTVCLVILLALSLTQSRWTLLL